MTSNFSPRNRLERILKLRKEALEKVAALDDELSVDDGANEDGEVQPDQKSETPDLT